VVVSYARDLVTLDILAGTIAVYLMLASLLWLLRSRLRPFMVCVAAYRQLIAASDGASLGSGWQPCSRCSGR
jgi:hypothetical protein